MITPLSGGRIAIRIRRADDRARRVVLDATVDDALEEWRCTRCDGWFVRESVTLVKSGRTVAGAAEISVYCAPCADLPRVRGGR